MVVGTPLKKKKRFNLNIIQSGLQSSVHSCMKSSHTRLRLFVLRVKNPIYSCNLPLQEVNWVNFALSGPCPRIWGLPVPFKAGFERTWFWGHRDQNIYDILKIISTVEVELELERIRRSEISSPQIPLGLKESWIIAIHLEFIPVGSGFQNVSGLIISWRTRT